MIKRGLRYVDEVSDVIRNQLALAYSAKELLAYGLRKKLREGYTRADFRADLSSALVVVGVALPLSMAIAIACDVPPQYGLYTAIIAGVIGALLGGTRFQVSGPTAAFVVILLPVVHAHGFAGLLVAGMLAGLMLVAMGLARLGRLVQLVPHPVTTGLVAGIALVIALLQLDAIMGVALPPSEGTLPYLDAVWDARAAVNWTDVGIAVATVALLVFVPRVLTRIPATVVVIGGVSVAVALLDYFVAGLDPTTIATQFSYTLGGEEHAGIPPLPPLPLVPWDGGARPFALDFATIRELLPSAFAIAMLGAIESLRAAVAADGMTGTEHDPNSELIALGIANVVCPFFGGIAAAGALARTATNIRAGARSPLSAAMHAILILVCTIALAPLVGYVPIAALAGLLLVVARNMSEARHFVRLARIAPRSDVLVMLTCFFLTIAFDMVVAVTVGIVLAALVFMRRMAMLTRTQLKAVIDTRFEVPPGVRVYEIAGPLFFGAAKTAMEALHAAGGKDHTVILAMQHVPTMDATGLVALESVLDRLRRSNIKVIFSGLAPEVSEILERAGIKRESGKLAYAPDIETAISMAIVHAARVSRPG